MINLKDIIFCCGLFTYGLGIRYYDLVDKGFKGTFIIFIGVFLLFVAFLENRKVYK